MKTIIPVILVLLSLYPVACLAAPAQLCKEPVKPELPPQKADSREMERTNREMNLYIKEMSTYRNCLLKLVSAADSDVTTLVAGWNHAVELYMNKKSDPPAGAQDETGRK